MYALAIGDRTYSSWSLRGWLLFEAFGIPVNVKTARMYTDEFPQMLTAFAPAKTVPAVLIEGQDLAIWDSLAVVETLHERHPDAGIFPKDASARALARVLCAEMHSGFGALREECTMNLAHSYTDFPVSEAVKTDIARVEQLWSLALSKSGGPWLLGAYSAADVFFAPLASRIATYALPVGDQASAYVAAHLNDGAFRRWRAMGRAQNYVQAVYELPHTKGAWPGPEPLPAKPTQGVAAKNALCPYSDTPIREDCLAEIDGQVVGFCNSFCRDKSVADAAAWPKLVALLAG